MKNKTLRNGGILTIIINLLFFASIIPCILYGLELPYSIFFITFAMFAYHTDVRIVIGLFCTALFREKINVNKKVYTIKDKEFAFLNKLKVKKWKDNFIALDRGQFILKDLRDEEKVKQVLQNNICAEIIHWICFFVGFLAIPLGCLMSVDEWYIYVITSVLTSMFADLPAILIQRFNRYRILQTLNKPAKK